VKVIVADDVTAVGRFVARLVEQAAPSVLGVATGSSPEPAYRELVAARRLAASTHLCLLDEYVGLPSSHPQRYRKVIQRELAGPLGIDHVHAPDVDADDLDDAATEYEQLLDELGGVDVQLLGIGRNGHIGFNEPGTSFDSITHVATLTETTRHDNARFFEEPDNVPRMVITQGLATISRARSLVLIATGTTKRHAVRQLVRGDVSPQCPATSLSNHPELTIVGDRLALDGIDRTPEDHP
jgi:glucosamine-6-phosphate deaminase